MKRMNTHAIIIMCLFVATSCTYAQSKVAITRDITWRPYQAGLEITNARATVTKSKLNLFNHKFKVRFYVSGQMRYANGGWEPRIHHVHYTERLFVNGTPHTFEGHGEIEITPLIDVKIKESYKGEWIPFSIYFDKWINTYTWGSNTFTIISGQMTNHLIVIQLK